MQASDRSAPRFEDFARSRVDLDDVTLSVARAGEGPALLLLHGYPQTSRAWERVAPALAERFAVIVPDLRGYGASDAPPDDPAHETYSKRRMALDCVGLLDALGIERAQVMGHDRGARVAYRMALDHADRVDRLAVVEIVPTSAFWSRWSADTGLAAWHWTFLAQPTPLPERMIAADPAAFCDALLSGWSGTGDLSAFSGEALADYRSQMADPARATALCADYRAGATIDRRLDEADHIRGATIDCPVLLLHGAHGFPARTGDPGGIWREWAQNVLVRQYAGGHFAMEEAPDDVIRAALEFFL